MCEVRVCDYCDSVYPMKYIVNTDVYDKEIGEHICIVCFLKYMKIGFEDRETICQCGKQMKVYYESNQILDTIDSKGILFFCCPDQQLIRQDEFFESCYLAENGAGFQEQDHDYIGIYVKQPKPLSYDPKTNLYTGKREYVYDLAYYFWYYEGSYFYGKSYNKEWENQKHLAKRKDELFFESYWRDEEREYLK